MDLVIYDIGSQNICWVKIFGGENFLGEKFLGEYFLGENFVGGKFLG